MGQAGARRTESVRATTQADQLTLLDMLIYNEWIKAYAAGEENHQRFYERRFRFELRPAFEAWLATDPANNLDAPTGPFVMPEYQVSKAEEAIANRSRGHRHGVLDLWGDQHHRPAHPVRAAKR
jgi:hypothetical protein